MTSVLRKRWGLSLGLCAVGVALAILYVCASSVWGQIPPSSTGTQPPPPPGQPTVQLDASSYTVAEGQSVTITVTLSAASTQNVSVVFQTSDGSGQQGVDYTAVNQTLTFSAGTTSQTVTISTMNDPSNSSYVTAYVSLSSPSGATLGSPSTAEIYIVNPSACQ